MAPVNLLITDRFSVDAQAKLQSDPRLKVLRSRESVPDESELRDCQILLIRSRSKITDATLRMAPNLQLIVTATSGFDHIDLEATGARHISVAFTPNANASSAAELTWALLLSCARRLPEAARAIKNGSWDRQALIGRELHGKTLGIVGLGRIGSRVAQIARAFSMTVLAFDPYLDEADFEKAGTQRVGFDELLRLADAVTFHVPETPETHWMLKADHLHSMPRHALLINAARGAIVQETVLIQALHAGWIAGCGLDVFNHEPLPRDSELLRLPGIVLTPHLGATTEEAFARSSWETVEAVLAFLNKKPIPNPLPPQAEWYRARFGKST